MPNNQEIQKTYSDTERFIARQINKRGVQISSEQREDWKQDTMVKVFEDYAQRSTKNYLSFIVNSVIIDSGLRLRFCFKPVMISELGTLLPETLDRLDQISYREFYQVIFKKALERCFEFEVKAFDLIEKTLILACKNPVVNLVSVNQIDESDWELADPASSKIFKTIEDLPCFYGVLEKLKTTLNKRQFYALIATTLEEKSKTEVAYELGVSRGRVSQILSDAKCKAYNALLADLPALSELF